MPLPAAASAPLEVALLLLPGLQLAALAGVLDALAAANATLAPAGGAAPYRLGLHAAQALVVARCGTVLQARPWAALATAPAPGLLVLVADGPSSPMLPAGLAPLLARAAGAGAVLAGIGTGAAWLAEAGLLAGRRAAVHWPWIQALAQRNAGVLVSRQRFEIDGDRLSAAGHQAGRDLMITWLGRRHGAALARELCAELGLPHQPAADECQAVPLGARLAAQRGGGSARLADALALMEANLAEPLPTEEIARLVGVSRRQLERLFRQHLDALPARWYIGLRLQHAQRLLRQTPHSVLQIALGCGFASGAHFSNAYRAHFGHTPRDERSRAAGLWPGSAPGPGAGTPDEETR